MLLRPLETQTIYVKGKKINGVSIFAHLISVATDIYKGSFDPSKMIIQIILRRKNKTYSICNEKLLVIVLITNFFNGIYDIIKTGLGFDFLVSANTGVSKTVTLPLNINFPTIDLEGDDQLEITIKDLGAFSGNAAAITAGNAITASSFLQFQEIESEDIEMGIPCFETRSLQPGITQFNEQFKNNIHALWLISIGAQNIQQSILTQLTVTSDKKSQSYLFEELVAKRHENENLGMPIPQVSNGPLGTVSPTAVGSQLVSYGASYPYASLKYLYDFCLLNSRIMKNAGRPIIMKNPTKIHHKINISGLAVSASGSSTGYGNVTAFTGVQASDIYLCALVVETDAVSQAKAALKANQATLNQKIAVGSATAADHQNAQVINNTLTQHAQSHRR